MKLAGLLALGAAVNAKSILRFPPSQEQTPLAGDFGLNVPVEEQFLIELSPGETAWVTEEEKWELRRASFLSAMLGLPILMPEKARAKLYGHHRESGNLSSNATTSDLEDTISSYPSFQQHRSFARRRPIKR